MQSLTNGNASQGGQMLPHQMASIPIFPMDTTTGLTSSSTVHQHQNSLCNSIHSHSHNDSANIFREQSTSTVYLQHPHLISHNSSVPFLKQTDQPHDGDENDAIERSSEKILIQSMEEDEREPEPEIDIVINNVVCSFSVRCHLNLREIALNGVNVEFRKGNNTVTMKLRRPYTTALMWSSGKINCTGATSEEEAKVAARRYARCLQKLGYSVRFHNFRVVNVLASCSMPWAIKLVNFAQKYRNEVCYEPELHPGATYKLKYPRATLKMFSTGSITITARSVAYVQAAIEHIFPLVHEFRNERPLGKPKQKSISSKIKRKHTFGYAENDPMDDNMMYVSESDDETDDETSCDTPDETSDDDEDVEYI